MVFFNCNNCSETFKLNKVEAHKFKCNFASLSCIDCQKDFDSLTAKSHKTCMTEDQRYGGKNYVPKELKGQKKQEQWINRLQNLISDSKFDRNIQGYFERILNYDNIPRKKAKFLNFVKASIVKNDSVAEKLWETIEKAINPAHQDGNSNKFDKLGSLNSPTNNENRPTANIEEGEKTNDRLETCKIDENGLKRKNAMENGNERKKKAVVDSNTNSADFNENGSSLDKNNADDLIGHVIQDLIERSKVTQTLINPTKLAKKVLKRTKNHQMKLKKFKKLIRRLKPYTEFENLPINDFYDKFIERLRSKKCFHIEKETITYKI